MGNESRREPTRHEPTHPRPCHPPTLAAAQPCAMPMSGDLSPERLDRVTVRRNVIGRDVATHYGAEPSPLLRDGLSAAFHKYR